MRQPVTKFDRADKRSVDLISDALPFGRLWYEDSSAAVDYAKFRSRSRCAVIHVYDEAGKVIYPDNPSTPCRPRREA